MFFMEFTDLYLNAFGVVWNEAIINWSFNYTLENLGVKPQCFY